MESSTNKVVLYGDLMSQPTRSVYVFLKLNKIPFQFKLINIAKGEQLKEDYKKINPFGKIPAITYLKSNGETFQLAESCTILRFLSDVYEVDEKWYPRTDKFRRALVDQWLDWHHLNTRYAFMNYAFNKVLKPLLESRGVKPKITPDTTHLVPTVIKFLDKLLNKNKYIVDDTISIADLIIAAEANQLILTEFDFSPYPKFKEYLVRINQLPEFKEVNNVLESFKAKFVKKAKF